MIGYGESPPSRGGGFYDSLSLSAQLLDQVAVFITYHKEIIEKLKAENDQLRKNLEELQREKFRPQGL